MPTLTGLPALIVRARVLATSAIAWLTALSATLVVLAQLLEGFGGVPEWVTRGIASAVAVIGAIVLQVRRVTPVADSQKGLLPPKGPAVEVEGGPRDVGEVGLSILFLGYALVCFVIFALAAHGTFTTDEGFTWLGAGLVAWVLSELVP